MSAWITRTRVRRHALMLLIVMWTSYAVTLATPTLRDRFGHLKGADFMHFYVLGSLALEHRGNALYDLTAQLEQSQRLIPQATGIFFVPIYGPQVSLFFAPFATLPYLWAWICWAVLTATMYFASIYLIWRLCPRLRGEKSMIVLLALAFPGFFNLITFGQNSALALACLTAAYLALRNNQFFLAGLWIGLLAYKPQLAIVLGCAFLLSRAGKLKLIAGAVSALTAQFAFAVAYFGFGVITAYWHSLSKIGKAAEFLEPKLYLTHSLRGFWDLLIPWHGLSFVLYAICAAGILIIAIVCWRREAPLALRFSLLLVATVLVCPHLSVYDLVIMAPALLFLGDWILQHPGHPLNSRASWLVYLSYSLPIFGPLARFIHLQLSVFAFVALASLLSMLVLKEWPSLSLQGEPSKSVLIST